MILESSVGSTHMAQALDSGHPCPSPFGRPLAVQTAVLPFCDSLCYTEKTLITNKVMTIFSVTPFKSISYTLNALPTEDSRMMEVM